MTPGQKSIATRMWNRGNRELEIAQWLELTPAAVKLYLSTRPGWPGQITGPPRRLSKPRPRPEQKSPHVNGFRRRAGGGPKAAVNGADATGAMAAARAKAALRGVVTLQRVRAIDDHRWACPVRVSDQTPRIWESV